MPFMLYRQSCHNDETLGQSWIGDDVGSNIELCEKQTISSVFLAGIPSGSKVLEAGCGLGRWVFFLRKHGIDASGIDLNHSAIAAAHAYDPAMPIEIGTVEQIAHPADTFDAVISLGVIEHFPSGPEQVIAEMRRVLRDDGILFLSIPPANLLRRCVVHPLISLKKLINSIRGKQYAFSEYRYTDAAVRNIIRRAGFSITEECSDELIPPLSIGLYTDFPFLQDRSANWKLNPLGLFIRSVLDRISPRISRGGVLFVCKKSPPPPL